MLIGRPAVVRGRLEIGELRRDALALRARSFAFKADPDNPAERGETKEEQSTTTLPMNASANPGLVACRSREEIARCRKRSRAPCRSDRKQCDESGKARGCAGNAAGWRAHNKKRIEWKHLGNCANYVGADVQL